MMIFNNLNFFFNYIFCQVVCSVYLFNFLSFKYIEHTHKIFIKVILFFLLPENSNYFEFIEAKI